MLPKVAVVLFVKNEFPDFCGWLAWYFSLGVDTILVHDDHSTDGTWEAALAASRCLDVRPLRTDPSIQPFTARQRDVYLKAIRQHRDEFDWIGFLDADEYLHLRERIDLPSFLARFPDAGAIAFSWCIYGSNGHLLKPAASTVEAFTRHSLPGFGHNRSVKSFVQSRFVLDQWRDPHTFEIGGAPYVDPQGHPVAWGGPGAIAQDPDWSVAKLMHFIPRSMEHFVERIRRRSDLRGVTNEYWNVFNMNDVEDKEALGRLPGTRPFLARIDREIMRDYMASLAAADATEDHSAARDPDREDMQLAVFFVATGFGTILALDGSNRMVHLDAAGLADNGCTAVMLASRAGASRMAVLLVPERDGPLCIQNDPRLSGMLAFNTEPDPDGAATRLRTPRTDRYLTALPPATSGIGQTSCDRAEANAWEDFSLVPVRETMDLPSGRSLLRLLAQQPPGLETLVALARDAADPMVGAAAIQLLPASQRAVLDQRTSAILPSWV